MADFNRPDPTRPMDPNHVAQLLGIGGDRVEVAPTVVKVKNPPANTQMVIDGYVYDPDFGLPEPQRVVNDVARRIEAGTVTAADIDRGLRAAIRQLKNRE